MDHHVHLKFLRQLQLLTKDRFLFSLPTDIVLGRTTLTAGQAIMVNPSFPHRHHFRVFT